jgi:25S rRNA (uracil2634-N3)-methyltransferase
MQGKSMSFDQHIAPEHAVILNLGLKNHRLMQRSIQLGLAEETRAYREIDQHLLWLLSKSSGFDFVGSVAAGLTLLVGEGNLSFALSLAKKRRVTPAKLVASTFEKESQLEADAKENTKILRTLGATVLYGVNAEKLSATLGSWKFDTIVFQFPHVGSREPVDGYNPNFILVRNFLKTAAGQLRHGGQVMISAVNSPHYQGAFQFDDAAQIAGFLPPTSYAFDPSNFPGYEHTMTHQSGSALDNHDKFRTWVFKKR